ncbi:MAG: GNVR domain-containing protein, partial [Pseudomonadota bacterium]
MPPWEDNPDGVAFRRYLSILLDRKWLILGCVVAFLGAAAIWANTRQRIYKAKASLVVEPRAPEVMGNKLKNVVELSPHNQEYMSTQLAMACSKNTATTVAKKLGLHRIKRFWPPNKKETSFPTTPEAAADRLFGLMRCDRQIDTNIIDVAIEHWDPETAAKLANAASEVFMDSNVGYRIAATEGATKWLAQELDHLKSDLEQSELALYNFKKENNLLSLSLSDHQSLLNLEMKKVHNAYIGARLNRMALGSQVPEADKMAIPPLELGDLPSFERSMIRQLRGSLLEARKNYLRLTPRYRKDHPYLQEKKIELEILEESLDREIRGIIASVTASYKQAKRHELRLKGEMEVIKERAFDVNKRELMYLQLVRDAETAARVYGIVLARLKENAAIANMRANNIRLLDKAEPSFSPIRPRIRLFLIAGGFTGLLLGIALALLLAFLDNTIKCLEDVEIMPGLACLGFVPSIPNVQNKQGIAQARELCVHHLPDSSTAESCRSIRTNLMFASPDKRMKKLVVTSPGPEEGKTTSAVSLAITMAQAGNRVLLIDADLRRPQLHRIFGLPRHEGLCQILSGQIKSDEVAKARITECVKTTEVPNLWVLPCG